MSALRCPLSIAAAEAKTPEPTYGTPANSNKPWIVPSSPQGPCSTGKTTSTWANTSGTSDCTTRCVALGSGVNKTGDLELSTTGKTPSVTESFALSEVSNTQRPSLVIPIGTTSYLV